MALRPLPAPMLARSGPLPARGEWAYEVKWDGFRCLISTEDGFRARSRRGWNLTTLVLELADLPVRGVFDGELVAWGDDGRPDFDLVCRRLLHGDEKIPLAYLVPAGEWGAHSEAPRRARRFVQLLPGNPLR